MPLPRIVIAGGSGFLGRALCAVLSRNHEIIVLTRAPKTAPRAGGRFSENVRFAPWVPDGGMGPWAEALDGAAAVVNLAGESIGAKRWSTSRKAQLRASRFNATKSLVAALNLCPSPPATFISASAVGYYGLRGDEMVSEGSEPGSDFLATLCAEWEAIARQAATAATRVVILRSGLVLHRRQGALPQMLRPFRFFVGGPVGSGRQYVSWIHLADWAALAEWALSIGSLSGVINATSPHPVPNAEFARTAGRVLRRPAFVRAPALAVRLLYGEMGKTLALGGQRVAPERALALGFRFHHPDLEDALRDTLRKR